LRLLNNLGKGNAMQTAPLGHWIAFFLSMITLIFLSVVPATDLSVNQKLITAVYLFLFGLIGFLIGRIGTKKD
jgi:hypothetical protein